MSDQPLLRFSFIRRAIIGGGLADYIDVRAADVPTRVAAYMPQYHGDCYIVKVTFSPAGRDQFVDAALVRAPVAIVEGETDAMRERTEGMMRDAAARLHDAGWTLEDVVALFRCMEHVSPDLPEDVALRRMHAIHQKYEKGGSR